MKNYIKDVYPKKAQFRTNENIEIVLELSNPDNKRREMAAKVQVMRLAEHVESIEYMLYMAAFESKTVTIPITPQDVEFEGFGIDICLYEDSDLVQEISTSLDVVSDWRKAPRYGFLSDFSISDKCDADDVKSMCRFHLNLVQFYDWMYRHDNLVPPVPEFTDLMGRKLNLDVVKEKISLCHVYGMKAVAYGAVYAASKDFYQHNKEWGFYNSSGEVYDFINVFKIMNIANDSPWHEHIIGEYKKAIVEVGFDGIHMDTYGFPKTAVSILKGAERIENLDNIFPGLINDTRKELEQVKPDVCLIFNNVGNWPVDTVACAAQDAVYVEVWEPYERYHHIQQIILWAKFLGKGKPVILAAYLKPFRQQDREEPAKAEFSALLLTSIIAANGGYHLLLGENNGILTQGYYVDYSTLDEAFARRLRDFYDFIVRYSKLLFDNDLRDVSMTHCGGENQEYCLNNLDYSLYGEPGKVWTVIKEKPEIKTIIFINLTNNYEDYWNKGKNEPSIQEDIIVKVQIFKEPAIVYTASPDFNHGRPVPLDYTVEDGTRGKVIMVKIPRLYVWSLLVMDFGTKEGAGCYEH